MEDKNFIINILLITVFISIVLLVIGGCYVSSQNKSKEDKKESFLSIHSPAKADDMGTITSGNGIFTDSTLNKPYSEVLNAVKNNKDFNDNQVLGAREGDGFEAAYNSMMQLQAIDGGKTGVKDQAEMTKIAKQINAIDGNNTECIFNRAGATKARIKLEPMGTAGVCQQYTPERDRNHEIRMVNNIIEVPGFDIDTNRIQDQFDSQGKYASRDGELDGKSLLSGSTAKMFSPNVPKSITVCGHAGKNIPSQVTAAIDSSTSTITESFSS